jgi:hypothetical protein
MKQDKGPDKAKLKKKAGERPTPQPELTPAELAMRQQQMNFLLEGPEERVRREQERKQARAKEVFELRSGETIAFASLIANDEQEYFPIFPNSNPFFSEMFRLVGDLWKNWDSKSYTKPLEAKQYLIEIIYYRFSKEAVGTLRTKVQRGKNQKLFQYLNDEGRDMVVKFRDEAIAMMKEFNYGQIYEFRIAYSKKYNTPVQLELGKEHA